MFKSFSGYAWNVWFGDYGHSIRSYFGAVLESKTGESDNDSYKFWSLCVSIPFVDPGNNKKWATEIYEYGVRKDIVKGNFNYTSSDKTKGAMMIGCNNNAGKVSLHCIRLYNRHLS